MNILEKERLMHEVVQELINKINDTEQIKQLPPEEYVNFILNVGYNLIQNIYSFLYKRVEGIDLMKVHNAHNLKTKGLIRMLNKKRTQQ